MFTPKARIDPLVLTTRQREIVLKTCALGRSRSETAYELGIGLSTIKNHITAILRHNRLPSMNAVCFAYGQETAKTDELIHEYTPCPECGGTDGDHAADCLAIN